MDFTRLRTVLALRWLYGWRTAKGGKFTKRFQNSFYTFNDWRSAMSMQIQWNEGCAKLIGDDSSHIADLDLKRFHTTQRVCISACCVATILALGAGSLITIGAAGWVTGIALTLGTAICFAAFLFQWTACWALSHNVPTLEAHLKPGTANKAAHFPPGTGGIKAGASLSRDGDGITWLNLVSPSGKVASLMIRQRPETSIIQRCINECVEVTK